MEPVTLTLMIGVGLAGALAYLAGIIEDAESDAGSASNPNSQVQLAPQIGHRHRYYNKAISGEPPQNALWAANAATIALLLSNRLIDLGVGKFYAVFLGAVIGALASCILLGFFGSYAHISRMTSMRNFKQAVYWDALIVPLPFSLALCFLTALLVTLLAFVTSGLLGNPFSPPLLAFLFGISLGSIASGTGDIQYGAERLYQHYIFGSGIAIAKQGDIDVKGEYGYRNSVDTPYFCMRLGGTVTALAFGGLIFLDAWSRLFDFAGQWTSIIVEAILILILFLFSVRLEKYTRDKYGPYPGQEDL